ncbi:hypothetical protein KUTeg_009731 [Tegillarca granosa]|uniref:SUEL-type lectin domain-containing protein n=1 Tax=Tegillarca granosa TaxID=220873 RepID=A0ABQ9F9S6_TEGGR|nr:hypothetical protein KUTeg_009731 [Tegillarca granosa]
MSISFKHLVVVIVSINGTYTKYYEEESAASDLLICENSKAFLRCNYGNYIDILSAKWGRDDNSTCGSSNGCSNMNDITSTIRFLCHGKQSCDILHVNEEKFGPVSCSGIRYLRIVHNCSVIYTHILINVPEIPVYTEFVLLKKIEDIDECGNNPCARSGAKYAIYITLFLQILMNAEIIPVLGRAPNMLYTLPYFYRY